jgi:hypothetical protein
VLGRDEGESSAAFKGRISRLIRESSVKQKRNNLENK